MSVQPPFPLVARLPGFYAPDGFATSGRMMQRTPATGETTAPPGRGSTTIRPIR